jgi:transposase
MPRGTLLTDNERGQISALELAGWSVAATARTLGRSRTVVAGYLKDKEGYSKARFHGRPTKLSPTATRLLYREAAKGKVSCRQLVTTLDLVVGHRRVQQLLRAHPDFVYKKRKGAPHLTPAHQAARVDFAKTNNRQDWSTIIFSDEKKFNLDGPDGWQYYWHHLQHEEQVFSRRQNGGGSVMVWGAFSANGKSELRILEGTQNSYEYTVTLADYLLPFAYADHGNEYVFQQDNASIHTSRETTRWLDEQEVARLRWPARSPDLNPIENLWGIMARRVYLNGRQFTDRVSLIRAIKSCWDEIAHETLQNLVNSMPDRCSEVLFQRGKKTKY